MDRGTWWATFHGSQRVGHNQATKQAQPGGLPTCEDGLEVQEEGSPSALPPE